MSMTEGHGKPNMQNLSGDLGRAIMKQIRSTPRPDWEKMEKEADAIEKKIIAARRK